MVAPNARYRLTACGLTESDSCLTYQYWLSLSKLSVDGVTQTTMYGDLNSLGLPQVVSVNGARSALNYGNRGHLTDSTTAGANIHIDYWPKTYHVTGR